MKYLRVRSVWTATLALLFATAAVIVAGWSGSVAASANDEILALHAQAMPDRLRVSWDADSAAVRRADAALLEVSDSGRVQRFPVPRNVLIAGTLDYLRHSEDVTLSLTMQERGRQIAQASVRMVGGPEQQRMRAAEPKAAALQPAPKREEKSKKPTPVRRVSRRR